jgi:lipid A ethanolaminephosphotransferase
MSLMAVVVLFVAVMDNATFWSIGADAFDGHPLSLAAIAAALFSLTLAAFSPFALPWIVKPFAIFILILSSVTSYYMDTLGVFIDREMIQNVMVTTVTESKHLITFGFVAHVILYGIIPSLAVLAIRVKRQSTLATFGVPILTALVCLALTVGLLFTDFKTFSSILRGRKDFMASYQPGAPIVGTFRYASMVGKTINLVVEPIGKDAMKGAAYTADARPSLTILVIGETARAQNFSLNGYSVETNPELAKLPVINFGDVAACGTATAVSLPCMFSKFRRTDYTYEKGVSNQNVLDVLDHAGLAVEWWDNNTGHKGIAERVPSRSLAAGTHPGFCVSGECDDGIFLETLQDFTSTITKDTVLVFHQIGSHGPAYYLRYPPDFEKFKPACRTAEFKKCTPQEIVNAYDNTIAYTDKTLAETIGFLQSQSDLATSLLYVSDHGESLGEGGLYLHGTPYFMAPETQTKVPMVLWMSDKFEDQFGHQGECLRDSRMAPISHDNLFHSLLGMLDIRTSEYDPKLDIFAPCKKTEQAQLK